MNSTVKSGLDIGEAEQVGSFFASMRQRSEAGDEMGRDESESMTGREYIERLIKQQETVYHKKLPFECGQYHQCIPNPRREDQLITVQLVSPILEGIPAPSSEQASFFNEKQRLDGNLTMKAQRFAMVSPNATLD